MMDQQQSYFVGYDTLEALLSTHERALPLFMAFVEEVRALRDPGVASRCSYLMVTDVQQGVARYWRYAIGSSMEVGGQPLDPVSAAALRTRGEGIKARLRRAIREHFDLTTQAATVSFPRELVLVHGATGLLRDECVTESKTCAA